MSDILLNEPPDLPVFHLDEVHKMQADLWQHAVRVLGPCTHDHTVAPARFLNNGTACTTRIGGEISIYLDINAARDWASCAAILGHEVVHALDGLSGHPSWLEEGIGCLFGMGQCAAMFGDPQTHLCRGAYLHALKLAASVPSPFEVVKSLRAQGLRMCSVTPGELMAAAPGVDAALAQALSGRFQSEPIGIARVHGFGSTF